MTPEQAIQVLAQALQNHIKVAQALQVLADTLKAKETKPE